jgi:hypothetical protein
MRSKMVHGALRRQLEFVSRAGHLGTVQSPSAKINRFSADPNHVSILCRLVPDEGRFAIVTNAGRDAVDAKASGAPRG